MSDTNALLTLFVDQERIFFNEEARRLSEFHPLTTGNQVAQEIYNRWYIAYTSGIDSYQRFDQTAQAIKQGDLETAKRNLNLPPTAPLTGYPEGDKRILALILLNDFLPSCHFQKVVKEQNRDLIGLMVDLCKAHPTAQGELDLLSNWIATFPHQQASEKPKKEEPGFFGSILETGVKVGIGYLIGRYASAGTGYTYEEGPPPILDEEETYF